MSKDDKFVNAVKQMEKATKGVHAFVVFNAVDPANTGRYVTAYSKSGGICRAIAWLPGQYASEPQRHYGSAKGYGYDKATAAMGGAPFYNLKTGQMDKLLDEGHDTRWQLESAGWTVIQAC